MKDKLGNTLNIGDVVKLVNPIRTLHPKYGIEGKVIGMRMDNHGGDYHIVSVEYNDHSKNSWFPNSLEKVIVSYKLPDELFEI